jgi:hypothetical protein
MAAGAIPPPLFFERRRHASLFAPGTAFSGTPEKHDARKTRRPKNTVSITRLDGQGIEARLPATGHRKDI